MERIFSKTKDRLAWVTQEQGQKLLDLIETGGDEIAAQDLAAIRKDIEKLKKDHLDTNDFAHGIDEELQELKTNYDNHIEEFKSLKQDESQLGQQVQHIQSGLNDLVRKDTSLDNLCRVEQCAWAKDITSQIDSNGKAIKQIQDVIGGVAGVPSHDLLFMTNKEISITLTGQQLIGSFYYYTFEYNIESWDNATYQLEGLIFKNLHKDDAGQHGQVEEKTKKALVTLTYDDTKMYGTIQTPNMLDNGNPQYQLIVTCLWKKVLS